MCELKESLDVCVEGVIECELKESLDVCVEGVIECVR